MEFLPPEGVDSWIFLGPLGRGGLGSGFLKEQQVLLAIALRPPGMLCTDQIGAVGVEATGVALWRLVKLTHVLGYRITVS